MVTVYTLYVEIVCMFKNNFEKSKIFYLRKKSWIINLIKIQSSLMEQSAVNLTFFAHWRLYRSNAFTSLISIPQYMYVRLGPWVSNNEYFVILIQWNIFPLPQCKQIGGGGVLVWGKIFTSRVCLYETICLCLCLVSKALIFFQRIWRSIILCA